MKRSRTGPRWKIILFIWTACAVAYAAPIGLHILWQLDLIPNHGEYDGHQLKLFCRPYGEYLLKHKGSFPPMNDPEIFVAAVGHSDLFANRSLGEVEALFVDPVSGTPYHLNGWLDKKNLDDLPDARGVVALYEDAFPEPGRGTPRFVRAVLYADGHHRVVRESEWPQLKRESHIP